MKTREPRYFAVVGRGHFPLDMLRYDTCYPVDQSDAANIENPAVHGTRERSMRLVVLATHALRHEPARWSSFMWTATGLFEQPYKARDAGKGLLPS